MADQVRSIPGVIAVQLLPGAQLCAAFSGGRDSSVLVHALAGIRAGQSLTVRALHVHHALHPEADAWARHCSDFCAAREVPLTVLRLATPRNQGRGLEAAAREARYAALAEALKPGEWLLTAHHQDDQLETLLLHLIRGSGVTGLAAIPVAGGLGHGRLLRPLLGVSAAEIQAWALAESLQWLEDPMNRDLRLDRNYLRAEILPRLRSRWPAVAGAAGRSAALAAEAADLLADLARLDAGDVVIDGRVSVQALGGLPPARQRNLVRHLVRQRAWPALPERRLRECLPQLIQSSAERHPVLAWGGHAIRRYRGWLYLLDESRGVTLPSAPVCWDGQGMLALGGVRGHLRLENAIGTGLKAELAGDLAVGFRTGGEWVQVRGDPHHRTLKYLFQSQGVVPWMRCHVPLIHAGGRLAAVGDLWVADWAAADTREAGARVIWDAHAELH